VSTPPSAPPRGWYTDPQLAGHDRWWDGTAWTEFTHRNTTLRYSLFGAAYARAWWTGPNRAAARSLLMSRIAVLVLIAAVLVLGLIAAGSPITSGVAIGFTAVVVAIFVMGVIALVYGILGVRRADVLGATLGAAWGIGLAVLTLLGSGAILSLVVIGAVRAA
jgi:hypothetical protein